MIFMTIGPRQMAGCSRSMRNPTLMILTPCASSGTIRSLITDGGALTPIMRGRFGP